MHVDPMMRVSHLDGLALRGEALNEIWILHLELA
jgi:hypothetical protein